MDASPDRPPPARLGARTRPIQWICLFAFSALLSTAFEYIHLPAALLIGPLVAGVVVGVNEATIRVPKIAFGAGQAVLGCLIATSISLSIFSTLADDWLLVIGIVTATLAASSFLGWMISRWTILPGTTGVWGSSPGAATAMVLMAGAFGADQRLVAFMQYARVSDGDDRRRVDRAVMGRYVRGRASADDLVSGARPDCLRRNDCVAIAGALVGQLFRLPSPAFLGAFILGALVHLGLDQHLQLPEWLLAISYAFIGWTIGLNFTRAILLHAARTLPQIVGSILALMAFCGMLAWLIVETLGVDPLTAYLATSPGGMDSVAIIAAASDSVDISFVMALQAARFIVVLILGPSIARGVARLLKE